LIINGFSRFWRLRGSPQGLTQTIYIYRAPNNVYFTRICLSKYLRGKDFPFDVKVSLPTRDRAEAVIRNIDVAGTLKKSSSLLTIKPVLMTLFATLMMSLTISELSLMLMILILR
jgi:hypothetical protein